MKLKKIMIFALSLGITMCNINTSYAYYSNKKVSNKQIGVIKKSKITFDVNGNEGTNTTIIKQYGETFGSLPSMEDYNYTYFLGWYTEPAGGTRISEDTKVPGRDSTYYARYQSKVTVTSYEQIDGGCILHLHVHDKAGISWLRFPTWSDYNGQDDLLWYDDAYTIEKTNNDKTDMDISFTLDFKNHNYEEGTYRTHVYLYNNDGGVFAFDIGTYEVENWPPQASDLKLSASNGKITVSGKVVDRQLTSLQLPTWSDYNWQDDIAWYDATSSVKSDGTFSYTIDTRNSPHGGVTGDYYVHLYAYDYSGKRTGINLGNVTVN